MDDVLEGSGTSKKRLKSPWFPKENYFKNFVFLSKTENFQNLSFPHFVVGMFFQ